MMTPDAAEGSVRDAEALPEELEWRIHPLMENAWRSALLIVIIVASLVGVWFWGFPGLVIPGALLLVVSVAPYLFPTRYRVTRSGIEIVFLGVRNFRGWEDFRNFYPHDVGVHLSTFKKLNALDSFRGSFIRFAPGNRESVLRFLDAHIRRPESERAKAGPEE
jgi:hypothetical protein